MAINPNTDFSSGAILLASQQNRFPRGVMGYVVSTSSTSLSTVSSDVIGATITFTAVANRLYKASFRAATTQNTATDFRLDITDGANNVQAFTINNGSIGDHEQNIFHLFTASAGSVTRKIRCNVAAGGGTLFGTGQRANMFVIEDLGPI